MSRHQSRTFSKQLSKIGHIFQQPKFQLFFIFFLAMLLRFYPMLLGKTLIFGDNYSLMVPGKLFTTNWLKQGVLPLWNPNIFAGLPWIGDVNQSILYPSTLLFLVFKPAMALNLTFILHLFIAYLGMYYLLKLVVRDHPSQIIGAVLWMLSTQVAGSLHNISTLQSIVWLPWICYFGLQIQQSWKQKLFFVLMVLMQFAGGYPQHVLYSIVGAVVLSLIFKDRQNFSWIEWLKHWLMTATLTISVSTVIWLPFIQLLQSSTRMEQTITQAGVGSLNPAMLIKMLVPYFFDKQIAGFKWGPAWSGQPNVLFYFSWLGLLCLFWPIKIKKNKQQINRNIAIFVIVTLVFALGTYLPGFSFIQKAIPVFRIGRYPSMSLILTTLGAIILISRKITYIKISKKWLKMLAGFGLLSILMSLLIYLVTMCNFEWLWRGMNQLVGDRLASSPFHTLARDKIIIKAISENVLVGGFLFILSLFAFYKNKTKWLILLIVIDLVYATQGMFIFAPNKVYDRQFINLSEDLQQYRLLTRNENQPYTDYGSYWEALIVREPFSDSFVDQEELNNFIHPQRLKQGLTPDWNMVAGTPIINGYTTLLPQDYAAIWQKSKEPRINFIDYIDSQQDADLLADWSVGYFLVDSWFDVHEDLSSLNKLQDHDLVQVYSLPAKPRIRFADSHNLDQAPADLQIVENPNRLNLTFTNTTDATQLIIADRYDSDWQATINHSAVTIENHNGMRLISIQPGLNEIEMTYRPRLFYVGLVISLFSLLISGLILQFERKLVNLKN